MEVIVALKFEVDEENIKPRLGNRNGGSVKTMLRDCVADVMGNFIKGSECVKIIEVGLCGKIGGNNDEYNFGEKT